jgi:hypothetical protein
MNKDNEEIWVLKTRIDNLEITVGKLTDHLKGLAENQISSHNEIIKTISTIQEIIQ